MKDLQVSNDSSVEKAKTVTNDEIFVPNVDISENTERVRLVANMPGVDQKGVNATVEKNVLTIEGQACVDVPADYELLGREFSLGKYRRDFVLSDAVDTDNIKARIQHGVLEVTLPKRNEVKTRKIEIEG